MYFQRVIRRCMRVAVAAQRTAATDASRPTQQGTIEGRKGVFVKSVKDITLEKKVRSDSWQVMKLKKRSMAKSGLLKPHKGSKPTQQIVAKRKKAMRAAEASKIMKTIKQKVEMLKNKMRKKLRDAQRNAL